MTSLLFQLVSAFLLLLAPLLTSCQQLLQPVDCSAIYQQDQNKPSGVYTIYPAGEWSAVKVYCDMTSEGGRWTVFQRRMDGTVNFIRGWDQYKTGFGNPAGEYWLGLDNIHYLTNNKTSELLVDMEDFEGNKTFARYSSFSVGAGDGFVLSVSGFINGGAGDSLSYHNGMKFSTFDKDQDNSGGNCASSHMGAFWYNDCHKTNPNGVYQWGTETTLVEVGMDWDDWKDSHYSLKTISMKVRPVL
ncbi:microfibril-associated glycoprotein 4-like isoform X2 [Perca fluviatilis]|uniref:microfibril-associated glycoprotein 4-like isoform X2 n=1 Tax=Perca fluviatilis TaxID=8168 RepID=UPI0019627625|nr:microfibril-associated glycoprotein 4-like isoform X2 [Perca fluviatilis]